MTPAAIALVVVGGCFGAAAREAVEQALPVHDGFPTATLLINVGGALCLGLLLETLLRTRRPHHAAKRHGEHPRRLALRLIGGTGFMGGFTTYSTFAVESALLVRAGHSATAALYVVATVAGGLVACVVGITAAAGLHGRIELLPVDPDVDEEDDEDEDRAAVAGGGAADTTVDGAER